MRKALVTGGAGFLGSSIVRELLTRGVTTRVLAQANESIENLRGLEVEIVRGDVMSPDDCVRATRGIDTVFHCAAIYKDYVADPTAMYHVNQRGTFNVLEAARRAEVGRVVYTASVVGLGRPAPGAIADETAPYDAWDLNFHYSRSKHLSMLTAFDFAAWGLDVRIVSPAVVFGPGDVGPTPSGKIILAVCAGKAPAYSTGGLSYVDVRDAARVHVLAAEKGSRGRMYIASGHRLENREFLATIARIHDRPIPKPIRIPAAVTHALVRTVAAATKAIGREPEMTPELVAYNERAGYYSNRRAVDELGATFRPIDETIRDAIAYFRGRGLVT